MTASRNRRLSNGLARAALVVLFVSFLLRLDAIRADSPGLETAGLVAFVVALVIFPLAFGVRFLGRR